MNVNFIALYKKKSLMITELEITETNVCYSKTSKCERRKVLGCVKDSRDNLDSSSIWQLW